MEQNQLRNEHCYIFCHSGVYLVYMFSPVNGGNNQAEGVLSKKQQAVNTTPLDQFWRVRTDDAQLPGASKSLNALAAGISQREVALGQHSLEQMKRKGGIEKFVLRRKRIPGNINGIPGPALGHDGVHVCLCVSVGHFCVCVCVCVCEWWGGSFSLQRPSESKHILLDYFFSF